MDNRIDPVEIIIVTKPADSGMTIDQLVLSRKPPLEDATGSR